MKKHIMQKRRWIIAIVAMGCVAFSCSSYLKFNIALTWTVTLVSSLILISLGEKIVSYTEERRYHNLHLLWGICSIIYMLLIICCIEQGTYITGEQYVEWLRRIFLEGTTEVEFQVGTLLIIHYVLILIVYGKRIWQGLKESVIKWVPNLWYLIIGIGAVLYIKERDNHMIRIIILGITGITLITYLLFKHFVSREQKIAYHISAIQYLNIFGGCLIIIISVGLCLPDVQELPGTRWIRKIVSTFSERIDWNTKIPYKTELNNQFPLSEAVLFEVNASEPLYLRSIAYSHYQDGVWSMASNTGDNYIALKPQYLHMEYLQTQSMLDEIAYQNSQNPDILPEYAKIASYESSVTNNKRYTVLQNPINKVNYFTVNGMLDIEDDATSRIYYYKNINTCYYHGDLAIEPSNYTIEYYDHVPKRGSREYAFLRNMNATTWSMLYRKVVANRQQYQYEYSDLPKLLLTYTPMVQYKNAKRNFLQIPKELKSPLESLARSIILSQKSDWERAEMICTYLKNQYKYKLHSEYSDENDRIYHFLFEEKEGICQEFASSMVLLCRSIGIPAKYVTGYLATERDIKTGNYIVREKDAHAFVEVYIAGYGWMTFDPTPEMVIDNTKLPETVQWSTKDYIKGICILCIIGMIAIITRGGVVYLQEWRLKAVFIFAKPEKQLIEILKCTMCYLEKHGYQRKSYETLLQYTNALKIQDIDIEEITRYYEVYIYGNKKIESKEIKNLYQTYKNLKLKLKNK